MMMMMMEHEELGERPRAMFKTLRRLHGQNLDHKGLNDLTEAFQTFMTRARFFSVGRIRRTWSHSAVEFMKYRRRLPALVAPDSDVNQDDDVQAESDSEYSTPRSEAPGTSDVRRVFVSNVSHRVTTTQLASFFSKFGRVCSCHIPYNEKDSLSNHQSAATPGTFPRRKSKGMAYITFKRVDGAQKAKDAMPADLKFYDKVMVVAQANPPKRKRHTITVGCDSSMSPVPVASQEDDRLSVASETSEEPESPLFSYPPAINILSDALLLRIINLLDILQRVRIERVSKKWLELSFKSWSEMHELKFSSDQLPARKPLKNSVLRAILIRCGRYVRSFDLSGTSHFLDDYSLQLITRECPNLSQIDLTGMKIHWKALKRFAEQCTHLEGLAYRDVVSMGEKAFWYLFRNCSNLKRVDMRGCRRLIGRCFRLLGLLLEEVLLDGCGRLEPQAIEEICLKSPNVRVLRLNECYKLTDESLSMISRCLGNNLQILTLSGNSFIHLTPSGMVNLGRLDTLIEIRFDYNKIVTDQVIEAVAEGIPGLKVISLAQAGLDEAITEKSLWALAHKCPDLVQVNFNYLSAVTDTSLGAIANNGKLRCVSVRGCRKLGDQGVMTLCSCQLLHELDISGSLLVTNSSIRLLISAFSKFTHNTGISSTVTLVVGGTSCEPKELRTDGSRVVLDTADYSTAYLCPAMGNVLRISVEESETVEHYSEDEMFSDDEFESLSAQRSFVLDALEEDDLLVDQDPFEEWEAKYGQD